MSHTCRIRKRLISLINFATFFENIRLARCEYNKPDVCTISLHLQSFSKKSRENMFLFEEECVYIRKRMYLYSKKCARITTHKINHITFFEYNFSRMIIIFTIILLLIHNLRIFNIMNNYIS